MRDLPCHSNNHNTTTTSSSNNINNNDLFSLFNNNTLNTTASLEALSTLFARLILQNHLTRLVTTNTGGALFGLPSASSIPVSGCCSSSSSFFCSSPCCASSHNHSHCGTLSPPPQSITNNNNSITIHTCPHATQPYMGPGNVFVIPSAHINANGQQYTTANGGNLNNTHEGNSGGGSCNQHPQQHQQQQNNHHLEMLLNALGIAMGTGAAGPSQAPCCPMATGAAAAAAAAAGGGGQAGHQQHPITNFSCTRCNFQTTG